MTCERSPRPLSRPPLLTRGDSTSSTSPGANVLIRARAFACSFRVFERHESSVDRHNSINFQSEFVHILYKVLGERKYRRRSVWRGGWRICCGRSWGIVEI